MREAVTMALYVCLVLAAEFVAAGEHVEDKHTAVGVIWGTAVGLALAHVFAFHLSARLFAGGRVSPATRVAAWAQMAAAAAVALIVTLPFLVFSLGPALDASGFILAALIGITAYIASRESGAGRTRSVVDGLVVLLVAMTVVSLKVALSGQ